MSLLGIPHKGRQWLCMAGLMLLGGCSSALPHWGTITPSGMAGVERFGDYPINLNPSSPSAVAAFELQDAGVPPPLGLIVGDPDVATPLSLPSGMLITTAQLHNLIARSPGEPSNAPLLVDVRSDKERLISIRGALWLNGLGYAYPEIDLEAVMNARMIEVLRTFAAQKPDRPLIFFCANPHCALSYNAALRAARLGHRAVYWYRGGVEAWYWAGLPLVEWRLLKRNQ